MCKAHTKTIKLWYNTIKIIFYFFILSIMNSEIFMYGLGSRHMAWTKFYLDRKKDLEDLRMQVEQDTRKSVINEGPYIRKLKHGQ